MARREFPPKVRVAAFERCGGLCERCSVRLTPGNVEYDHHVPDGLGGEPTIENCLVLCRNCHGEKTAKHDVPAIARTKRVARKHIGAAPKSRNPIAGSKASRWKRRLDGTTVPRDQD